MKILIALLASLFLINCYSYKAIAGEKSVQEIDTQKVYKLVLNNKKTMTVIDLKREGDYYIYRDQRRRQKSISTAMVVEIKERKFSWAKTAGLVLGISTLTATVVVVLALSGIRIL